MKNRLLILLSIAAIGVSCVKEESLSEPEASVNDLTAKLVGNTTAGEDASSVLICIEGDQRHDLSIQYLDGENNSAAEGISDEHRDQAPIAIVQIGLVAAQVAGHHHENAVAAEEQPAPHIRRPHPDTHLGLIIKAVIQKLVDAHHEEQSCNADQVNAGLPLHMHHLYWAIIVCRSGFVKEMTA